MGREAICTATWQGATSEAKVLLESTEIILRGDLRARIPRTAITGVVVEGGDLVVDVSGAPLTLELGAAEAAKWAAALLKAPPTLAEKLGLADGKRAFVLGTVEDDALATALGGATVGAPADADMIVAVLFDEAGLSATLDAARAAALPVWLVAGKAKFATVADGTIRGFMRSNGYIDTKVSGISDRWTATRYSPR
ncbi:hypothetical protein [Sphingomonas sp. SUN039]|uniref:hypothetical protein n=1 Tax=Sphingomonas sp. SUN039 TaxID=2937787 RepID=UPI002164C0EC|nr:hypothetical protein [Sphingomonas sp. SUN039]UVO53249.1 hypothetical protein M0209_03595 [Sphingomonas sp. SUN039]